MKMFKTFLLTILLSLPLFTEAQARYYSANFNPYETISVSASASSASSTFTLTGGTSFTPYDVLVYNGGTQLAFVGCGTGAQTAVVPAPGAINATPVAPGAYLLLGNAPGTTCAAITATSTTTIYFTSGMGD